MEVQNFLSIQETLKDFKMLKLETYFFLFLA